LPAIVGEYTRYHTLSTFVTKHSRFA
jgi:hypothetical protein